MDRAKALHWVDQSVLRISSCSYLASHYISSLFQRRSVTSYGEFPAIPNVRSRSARGPTASVIMPRNHVSIARFYDWTEDLGDCISVSRLYRDLANIPRLSERGRGKSANWCSNGVRITPGRMFSREKGALTKGEREIIEGIYRNRSDTSRDGQKQESPARSHHEAWFVGQPVPRDDGKEEIDEFKVPQTLFIKSNSIIDDNNQHHSPPLHSSCRLCTKETGVLKDSKPYHDDVDADVACHYHDDDDDGVWAYDGPSAPPTTPDKLLHKRALAHDSGSSETSFTFDSPKPSLLDSPRKVRVNVYLPAVGTEQTEDDIKTYLLHGKSPLWKERPLSQSDFKPHPDRLILASPIAESRAATLRRPSRNTTPRDAVGVDEVFRAKFTATPLKLQLSE